MMSHFEIDYFFVKKNTLSTIFYKKIFFKGVWQQDRLELGFYFRDVEDYELSRIRIFNHLLLLWQLNFTLGFVKHVFMVLDRGVKYVRFNFLTKFCDLYLFIEFLVEIYLPFIDKTSFQFINEYNNCSLFFINELNPFANIRLGNSFYSSIVYDTLYIKFFFCNFIFLSLLKIL